MTLENVRDNADNACGTISKVSSHIIFDILNVRTIPMTLRFELAGEIRSTGEESHCVRRSSISQIEWLEYYGVSMQGIVCMSLRINYSRNSCFFLLVFVGVQHGIVKQLHL